MRIHILAILTIASAAAACDTAESSTLRPASTSAPATPALPATPVDSYFPPEEALRRFREGVATRPAALAGGAPSRDSLVRLFVGAVDRRDTTLVNRMVLTRAEFAYLYYPSAPLARPPYELDPQMMWYQLVSQSEKGIVRAFDRMGGTGLRHVGHACTDADQQGENRVWSGCTVTLVTAAGDTTRQRLFGSVVERGGRFKFVSYANDM